MIVPRLVWEAILLLFAVAVTAGVMLSTPFQLGLAFWYPFAALGLLATGFALSVRTGTPNLAVAAIASLSGVVYAKLLRADWPGIVAGALAVALALAIGLVLGAITGLTKAPGWAVSLGGLALVSGVALSLSGSRGVMAVGSARPGWFGALLWSLVFVAASVGGGLLFLPAKVREFVGAHRIAGALAGFAGSSVLAGISGVVLASFVGGAFTSGDSARLFLAVAAALLGGVSLAGSGVGPAVGAVSPASAGVGGIAGTVLATALLVMLDVWARVAGLGQLWTVGLLPGLAILCGVLVSRLLDSLSRQAPPPTVGVSG